MPRWPASGVWLLPARLSRYFQEATLTTTDLYHSPALPRRRKALAPTDEQVFVHTWIFASAAVAPARLSCSSGIPNNAILHSLAFLSMSSRNLCCLPATSCCLVAWSCKSRTCRLMALSGGVRAFFMSATSAIRAVNSVTTANLHHRVSVANSILCIKPSLQIEFNFCCNSFLSSVSCLLGIINGRKN